MSDELKDLITQCTHMSPEQVRDLGRRSLSLPDP